jgi:hypothetical protein
MGMKICSCILILLVYSAISVIAFDGGPDGISAGWKLNGKATSASIKNGVQHITLTSGENIDNNVKINVNDGIPAVSQIAAKASLTQSFKVTPNTVYLLQLKVKSNNSVVISCAGRRMSYSTPGQVQLLADLVKSNKDLLEVSIELGGLPGGSDYELSDFELRPPQFSAQQSARTCDGSTVLNNDTTIVYPADQANYKELAELLQKVIQKKTGLILPVQTDLQVVMADRPVLLTAYRQKHLILLGRLSNNQAIWSAYNKFLTAVDGYYPGGDGFEVRTASNVFDQGFNHIILGGSSDAGVRNAVTVFAGIINNLHAENNLYTLPFLLKVQLGGKCLDAFDRDEKLWNTAPGSAGPRLLEAGYGKIVRWYVNVMNYYWSGRVSYLERAKQYLPEIIKDEAYTHQYIVEFFVRAYTMVDDSNIFTSDERKAIDGLIKKNFMDFLVGPDLHWMTNFNRPYERIAMVNRHSIAPWMADFKMADFLSKKVSLSPDESNIVNYRYQEKKAFFDYWTTNSFNASLPRTLEEARDEGIASMFRYSLDNEKYEFFISGNAKKALTLWEMSPLRPLFADDQLLIGIDACYYRDGRYASLYNMLPTTREHFQMRYVNGVHRYAPGSEIVLKTPNDLAGVTISLLQPQDYVFWRGMNFTSHKSPDFPAEQGVEIINFRSGFEPDADYMEISGLGPDVGNINQFYSFGKNLLMRSSSSTFGSGSDSYYDQNGVSVQRVDRWNTDPEPYMSAARLVSLNNQKTSGSVVFSISPFAGCKWQRSIVWIKNGLYVIQDQFTALESGEYLIQIGWRPQGLPSFKENRWTGANGNINFYVTSLGEKFQIKQNLDEYLAKSASTLRFHNTSKLKLDKDESITAYTLLEVLPNKSNPSTLELGQNKMVKLKREGEDILIKFGTNNHVPELITAGGNTNFIPLKLIETDNKAAIPQAPAYEIINRQAIMQLPGKVAFTAHNGVVDFGRIVDLAEVRNGINGRTWTRNLLPDNLEYSVDGKTYTAITSPKLWRTGIKTANYGQANPQSESYQYTLPDVKARYVRGDDATKFTYYASDRMGRRNNLEIIPIGDQYLVQSEVYPRYIRDRRNVDDIFALLDHNFKPEFTYRSPAVLQDGKILNWPDNQSNLVVITDDAIIKVINEQGKIIRNIDLYKLQANFHKQYGYSNTRQPAGGYTLPFSMGVWQATPNSPKLLVVGRYCYYSFIRPDGSLAGLLSSGEYGMNSLLDNSADLDGDGKTELYGLGTHNLCKVYGEENSRVETPGGVNFYFPQIFQRQNHTLPASGGNGVEADKLLYFEIQQTPIIAVVRQSFFGFFDAKKWQWEFTWVPPLPLTAAARIATRQFLVSTTDNQLWVLDFNEKLSKLEKFSVITVDGDVRKIRAIKNSDSALIATAKRIYLYSGRKLTLLLAGDFLDAAMNIKKEMLALCNNGELLTAQPKGE